MQQTRKCIFAMCLLVGAVFTLPALGKGLESDLAGRVIDVRLSRATLLYALGTLAVKHKVPIGLERSPLDSNEPKISVEASGVKLADVLDSIVRQEPNYRWEIRDGVVNFVPAHSGDEFLEKLLRTPVTNFAPVKTASKFQIRNAIINLAEVRRLLEINNVGIGNFDYPSLRQGHEVNLSISNTDVRGVLNKVVRESEDKLWIVELTGGERKSLRISL